MKHCMLSKILETNGYSYKHNFDNLELILQFFLLKKTKKNVKSSLQSTFDKQQKTALLYVNIMTPN